MLPQPVFLQISPAHVMLFVVLTKIEIHIEITHHDYYDNETDQIKDIGDKKIIIIRLSNNTVNFQSV